jgi:hypothetical protein
LPGLSRFVGGKKFFKSFHRKIAKKGKRHFTLNSFYRQFRVVWPTIVWTYLPTLVVLGGISIFAMATGRRVWYFTNDLFVLGHLPFYAGVLSSLGNVLWGAGATVCFFSAMVVGKRGERGDGRWKREDGSNYPRPSNPMPYTLPLKPFQGSGKKKLM